MVAVTSQRVRNVLFYVNILQCFFVVENFTANAVSVAIGDNGISRVNVLNGFLFVINIIFLLAVYCIPTVKQTKSDKDLINQ